LEFLGGFLWSIGAHPSNNNHASTLNGGYMDSPRLLRLPQVEHRTGLRRSTIYALVQRNDFPRQIKLSARAVAWDSEEVDQWVQTQIALRDAVQGRDRGGAQ
jgi:prophage regulatory protein